MRIALIADTYPPLRTSGAVQLRDLSRELVHQGHDLTVILPSYDLCKKWRLDEFGDVQVLRLKAPQTKDINYLRRTIGEIFMPFYMRHNFQKCPLADEKWEGIVWYSPTIFHGPFVKWLKKLNSCKGYLIIRDIFPDWAADVGLMSRGLPYRFFDAVARYQYSAADMIGVQTSGNLSYFSQLPYKNSQKIEVLQNWLANPAQERCSFKLEKTSLAGRKVFVYAGNMGVAQGMGILLDLAEKLKTRVDVGFLFVGRGSDVNKLKKTSQKRRLHNVLFLDEINPDEIPDLYAQCSIGIVALHPCHQSHNIPGKFITYMQCGLPVLANINSGNDLVSIIRDHRVGQVSESNQIGELFDLSIRLLEQVDTDHDFSRRCRNLFEREFTVKKAASQIVFALSS